MTANASRTGSSTASLIEREVVIERVINAPRELVFKAWTDPRHLAKWWGPGGFTNPVCKVDLRVGGAWHIVMRTPNGAEHPCGGIYKVIEEPTRLVFTNNALNAAGNAILEGLTTVTFMTEDSKTKLVLTTRASGFGELVAAMLGGMQVGWSQSIDRLKSVAEGTFDREFFTQRVFNAPRALVFKAWTDPTHLALWWGPKGFTNTFHEFDLRPGGTWRFTMHGPDGEDYLNESVFEEIVPTATLRFRHLAPMHEFYVAVTFNDFNGATLVDWRMIFSNAEEFERVKSFIPQANEQNLDRLAAHLKKMGAL